MQSVTDDELMGTTVVIQHDGGLRHPYSSLTGGRAPVEGGQTVAAGDVIGCVGTTSAARERDGPAPALLCQPGRGGHRPHDYVNGGE